MFWHRADDVEMEMKDKEYLQCYQMLLDERKKYSEADARAFLVFGFYSALCNVLYFWEIK